MNVVDQPLVNSLESIGAISFWIPVAVVLLAVLGLLWAPPAALTCMLAARFRKLEGESYAAAGAQHSMLLVLPWVYLLVRLLSGRALPVFIVAPVYILVYAIWFIFYIVGFNVGVLIASIVDVLVAHSQPFARVALVFVVSSVMLPINVYTWRMSIGNLRHRYALDKEHPRQPAASVPDGDYLAPFIWLIAWSIVVLFIIIVAAFL